MDNTDDTITFMGVTFDNNLIPDDIGNEPMVRELVAYGDTIDYCAFDLVWGFSMDGLAPNVETEVRTIISKYHPYITDSLLEDIMEDMQPEPDDWNE